MLKKYFVSAVALAALSIASSAFAAVTATQAMEIARKEVPAGSVFYGFDSKDPDFVAKFRNNATYIEYFVNVAAADGKLLKLEVQGSNAVGSTLLNKTEADVKNAILAAYPDAQDIAISYVDQGENNKVYKATFNTPKFRSAEAEISPVTCALGKCQLIYR